MDAFIRNLQQKLIILALFSLPFIIPLWCVSRSGNQGNWQKIRFLNEEGIRYCGQKEYEKSIEYFTGALKLDPENKTIRENLAGTYVSLAVDLKSRGERDKAIKVLEQAVLLNVNLDSIHILLAKLYYEKGDLFDAKRETRIALLLKPNDPYLLKFSSYLNYLMEDYNDALADYNTIEKTYGIPYKEAEYNDLQKESELFAKYRKMNCHPFVIFYPDESYKDRAEWISQALAKVYLKLASWWNYNPQNEIPVYLYPEKQFLEITKSRMDVVGIYDGKIRLLVDHSDRTKLEKTAVHEYTHHAFSCLTHSNTPFWCNEGLAQYVAGQWDEMRAKMFDVAVQNNKVIDYESIETINDGFFDTHNRAQAYIQSYVTVKYLIDTFGEAIICEIIDELKKGNTARQAVEELTLLSYAELEQEVKVYYIAKRIEEYKAYATLISNIADKEK
ncbi:MAG: peptidase MA family metallohydrolase [Candidatus Auribacterota bacterium]|jgi:tetratricopeptide (TPR) repeat protein|nr:peptidase MA family metallohydrolase [Candidatus Auribacterota bacterium]